MSINENDARHSMSGTTTMGVAKIGKRVGLERLEEETDARIRSRFLMKNGAFDAFNKLQRWVIKNPTSLEAAEARLKAKRNSYKEKLALLEDQIKCLKTTYKSDPKVQEVQQVISEFDSIFIESSTGLPDSNVVQSKGLPIVERIKQLVDEVAESESVETTTETATASS
jgi:hypothetical protein